MLTMVFIPQQLLLVPQVRALPLLCGLCSKTFARLPPLAALQEAKGASETSGRFCFPGRSDLAGVTATYMEMLGKMYCLQPSPTNSPDPEFCVVTV